MKDKRYGMREAAKELGVTPRLSIIGLRRVG